MERRVAALTPASVEAVLEVVQRDPGSRSDAEWQVLVHHLLSFQCFRDLPESSQRLTCCQRLQLVPGKAAQVVLSYHEAADRFFLLLRGKVAAKVPTAKLQRSLKAKESRFGEAVALAMGAIVEKQKDVAEGRKAQEQAKLLRRLTLRDDQIPESHETVVATLYPGSCFGEEAFTDSPAANASYECVEDSLFLTVESRVYKALQQEYAAQRTKEHVKLLHEIPAFSKWTRKSLGALVGMTKERTLQRGEVLYREGEAAESVYFIADGEFKFCKRIGVDPKLLEDLTEGLPEERKRQRHPSPARGGDVAVLTKSSKQVFGYQEVMEETDRKFTCVCLSRTSLVLELSKTDFMRRTQSQDTWHVLQRMSAAEKTWIDIQLSKLNHAELEKCRIALRKPRPKTPSLPTVRQSHSPENSHKRVSSLAENRMQGVNSSFEVSRVNAAGDVSRASGSLYRTYRDKDESFSYSPVKRARRRQPRPDASATPDMPSDTSNTSKSALPGIQRVPHFHNFSFPASYVSGRETPS